MVEDSLPLLADMSRICLEDGRNSILPFVEPIRHELPLELRDRFYFDIHYMLERFVRSAEGMRYSAILWRLKEVILNEGAIFLYLIVLENAARLKLPKNLTTHQKHYLLTVMLCMGLRLKSCR